MGGGSRGEGEGRRNRMGVWWGGERIFFIGSKELGDREGRNRVTLIGDERERGKWGKGAPNVNKWGDGFRRVLGKGEARERGSCAGYWGGRVPLVCWGRERESRGTCRG